MCISLLAAPAMATEGWYTVNAGGESVSVFRDGYGVPHIQAQSEYGVYFAMGYVVAEDRLVQFENNRRYAKGCLAEIYGTDYAYADYMILRDYYTQEEMSAQYDALPDETKLIFQAYTDGLNARIDEVQADPEHKLPKEFWDRNIPLVHVPVLDLVAMCIVWTRRLGERGGYELENLDALNRLGPDAFNQQYPINNPNAPATIRVGEGDPPPGYKADTEVPPPQKFPHFDVTRLAERIAYERDYQSRVAEQMNFMVKIGSYGILLSPGKSASGHGGLVACPSVKIDMPGPPPQSCNEIELHAPGINIAGANTVGVPCVMFGHTNHFAWTFSSGRNDIMDTFIEQLNPDNPNQYLYNGEWHWLGSREVTVQVKDQPDLHATVYRSLHGTIFEMDLDNHLAFSWKRTFWCNELQFIESIQRLARATTIAEWRVMPTLIPVTLNCLYTGVNGDIAWVHSGYNRVPAPSADPRLPVTGDGSQEWVRMRDISEQPQLQNPPKGYIANFNNKPAWWWNNGDFGWFDANHYSGPIFDYLDTCGVLTFAEFADIPHRFSRHGTYEQAIEVFPPFANAENILPPGQNGFVDKYGVAGPHSSDQQALYDNWQRKPFLYTYTAGEGEGEGEGEGQNEMLLAVRPVWATANTYIDVPVVLFKKTSHPAALSFTLQFDSAKLRFVSMQAGFALTAAGKQFDGDDSTPGEVQVHVTDASQPPSTMNVGDLLWLSFYVRSTSVPGEILHMTPVSCAASDAQGSPIPVRTVTGVISVTNGSQAGQPLSGEVLGMSRGGWVETGAPMQLNVRVEHAFGQVTYQWRKDGADLAGQTGSTLYIPAATADTAGAYTCWMTDDGKSTFETVPVLVTVFPADSLPGDTPIGLLLLLGSFLLIGLMKGRTRPAPPRNREDDPSGGPWKRPLKC